MMRSALLSILLAGGVLMPAYGGPADLQSFMGGRTRVVWCQDISTEGDDVDCRGGSLKLMGLDTGEDGKPHPILDRISNYRKPLLTSSGDRIVFSDYKRKTIFVVNWDGSDLKELGEGLAAAVWKDPLTGLEWVYVLEEPIDENADFAGKALHRIQIDNPRVLEPVWDETRICPDNFQLSADGKKAAVLFPWPNAGILDLEAKRVERLAKGCWTSMSPDNNYLVWVFDGAHRNITLFDPAGDHWSLPINQAPGAAGYEVYHPRWSNQARFFCMTGPYKIGDGRNRIEAGGKDVEVYIGKFSDDFRAVEDWFRVTRNDKPDFFPDVWVEGTAGAQPAVKPRTPVRSGDDWERAAPSFRVTARLVEISPTPTLQSIAPYRSALVVYAYQVEKVLEGEMAPRKILVCHWAIKAGQTLTPENRIGHVADLTLERFEDHPELEGERLIMNSSDFDLPMYYDVGP